MTDWDFVYEPGVELPNRCGRILLLETGEIIDSHVCLPKTQTCQCGMHRIDRRSGHDSGRSTTDG